MQRYPLLFGFRDLVPGDGYLALVATEGRALLVEEEDGFTLYGVNPGGLGEGGATPAEAHAAFRASFRAILLDIAADAPTLEAFRAEVEAFFAESDEVSEREWHKAVRAVRAGRVTASWLPTKDADTARSVKVLAIADYRDVAEETVDRTEHMAA